MRNETSVPPFIAIVKFLINLLKYLDRNQIYDLESSTKIYQDLSEGEVQKQLFLCTPKEKI